MQLIVSRGLKWAAILAVFAALAFLGTRAFNAFRGPALQPWHTFVPEELHAGDLDAADWGRYIAQEEQIFASVRREVTEKLEPDARVVINRYFEGSPDFPERFANNWNRS